MCVIIILGLFTVYHLLERDIIPTPKDYWINFENNGTYVDEDLSMAIGNNGLESAKKLNIHGIENGATILSSLLGSQSGKMIEHLNFGGLPEATLVVASNGLSSVEVSAQNILSGKYYGWLYLTGATPYTIPITLSTAPKVVEAFLLVVIGVSLSVAFWEIFFYVNLGSNQRRLDKLGRWIGQGEIIRNQLSPEKQNAADVNQFIEFKNLEYKQEQWKRLERIDHINNRYKEPSSKVKILTFDVASVIFGILTALVGLSSNGYVIGLVEISPIDVVMLIGIGLGIGSLKGIVDH